MKKWYVDRVFIRNGRVYDRWYYIREDGIIEWTELNGETHEFPIEECFHEDGTPITVEDGELLGEPQVRKGFVIINEQHKLFPEQEKILRTTFTEIEYIKVPSAGWTLDEMRKVAYDLHKRIPWDGAYGSAIVFASPIPFLLRELTEMAIDAEMGDGYDVYTSKRYDVLVFHNDRREKKELPDGRIIQTVAATGWQLV